VGGQGRLHIFHLPEGPSMLQVSATKGNRRTAISTLQQVTDRMKLSHSFPVYQLDPSYKSHMSDSAMELEKKAVSLLTADGIMAELKEITSFDSRSFMDSKASKSVQDFLQKKFEGMGYTTCEHEFMNGGPATNLVAYAPGTDGSEGLVVLGAHYDDVPKYGLAPGAEDNGSGLAALLAIMKAFKDSGAKTKENVAFVAFAGEELGMLGSDAYAYDVLHSDWTLGDKAIHQCMPPEPKVASFKSSAAGNFMARADGKHRPKDTIKAIIMDEIGWQSPSLASPTVNLETYDWTSEIMEQLAHASRDHNGAALTIVHSKNPFGSDHMSFLNRKVPAVLTINGDDEAYPFYHTSRDEIEHVTGSLVAMIAKMNMGGLLRIAEIDA